MSEVEPPKAEVRKTLTNMPAMETPQSVTHQMMSEDEITRRISKAEEEAKRDYNGYRRKVLAFALVGYIYILFVPMVLVLLMAGSVWFIMQTGHLYGFEIQIVLGLLIALFAYLRALWVPLAPPTGLKLERSDYP
jgi:polyferredoxin